MRSGPARAAAPQKSRKPATGSERGRRRAPAGAGGDCGAAGARAGRADLDPLIPVRL